MIELTQLSKVIYKYLYYYVIPISRISDLPSGSLHSILDVVPSEQGASEWASSGCESRVLRMVGLEVPRIATAHSFLYILCRNVDGKD